MPWSSRPYRVLCLLLASLQAAASLVASPAPREEKVRQVTSLPGLVAFWDFVKREPSGEQRFLAHVPPGATNEYPLDATNYVREYWGRGREASYADFPLMGRGPFGQAILIRQEDDEFFRPMLEVPRERLHDTPLDIKGSGRALTVVAWAIRQSGGHALAGIWHEGTDLKKPETEGILKAVRGGRQYGLFAGNNISGTACAHLSENGAGTFLNLYAMHKSNSLDISPAVPADSPAAVLDRSWQCFAMTFDSRTQKLTSWLNGRSGDRWFDDPKKNASLSTAYQAWKQGHLRRQPGLQEGEDPAFPEDQFYNPPEDRPLSVEVLREGPEEKVEVHEYPYTRVQLTFRKDPQGQWQAVDRDLVSLRLNPWWYPHDIYAPEKALGSPFSIGRVIHSARTVGFTGWIGGVAVYDRALSEEELKALAALDDEI